MTLDEIRALVISADPDAQHYESAKKGAAYTVWREYRALPFMADGQHQGGLAFQIDRFTKAEDDDIAAVIFGVLEQCDRVAFDYWIDYEPDTRYIHHIFDCEGI